MPPPEQTPITIRLLHEQPETASSQTGPASEASNKDPQDARSTSTQTENKSVKKPKKDGFYHAWDKFKAASSRPTERSLSAKDPNSKSSDRATQLATGDNSSVALLDADSPAQAGSSSLLARQSTHKYRSQKFTSFDEAATACRCKVRAIVAECHRLNKKYHDPLFSLPADGSLATLQSLADDHLPDSIVGSKAAQSAKRVGEIFEDPKFVVEGATANDVQQGYIGDCWFLAAVTALSGASNLLDRLCVDRDEKVGVYGFCFFRDGQWIYEVIDDELCVKFPDNPQLYLMQFVERGSEQEDLTHLPRDIRRKLQQGQRALYFSSCSDGEETWLPLIEKAYAKAHGDYEAIEAGLVGEGIEDLTGGVNFGIEPQNILDKDLLWKEFLEVNKTFLFGCAVFKEECDAEPDEEPGLVPGHAYTVLEARELRAADGQDVRLLKIRNPWGKGEWRGAWSDGSKEWDPAMMEKLNHKFGNDGIFWIAFDQFLEYFHYIEKTRIFDESWVATQQWTSISVPRSVNYLDTEYLPIRFVFNVETPGPVVIVLAQPDDRYFRGFQGRYSYDLHFRLYRDEQDTYMLRSMQENGSGRSCSAEVELEPGMYTVRVKISSRRYERSSTVEDVIESVRKKGDKSLFEKLLAVGKSFDSIHSKAGLRDAEEKTLKSSKTGSRKQSHDKMRKERNQKREKRRRQKLRDQRRKAEKDKKVDEKRALRKAKEDSAPPLKKTKAPKESRTSSAESGKPAESKQEQVISTKTDPKEGPPSPAGLDNGYEEVEPKVSEPAPTGDSSKQPASIVINPERAYVTTDFAEAGGRDLDDVSEVSSVCDDDFSWDSEVDGSASDLDDEKADDESQEEDPWNAICVVNVRVYSQNTGMKLEVLES